jgi:hypothetical protein
MDAVCSSEMFAIIYKFKQPHNPEDHYRKRKKVLNGNVLDTSTFIFNYWQENYSTSQKKTGLSSPWILMDDWM